AFLAGLRLAKDVGAREVKIFTDSQLVVSQVIGEYQAKNDHLQEYLRLVKEMLALFDHIEVKHVPRGDNTRADILSKLASTKKKGGNKSVIQEILPRPSIEERTSSTPSVLVIDVNSIKDGTSWMTNYYMYLAHGHLPENEKEAKVVQ
ncbi:gag-pol polyprotein, partial [Trifolium pratense]